MNRILIIFLIIGLFMNGCAQRCYGVYERDRGGEVYMSLQDCSHLERDCRRDLLCEKSMIQGDQYYFFPKIK